MKVSARSYGDGGSVVLCSSIRGFHELDHLISEFFNLIDQLNVFRILLFNWLFSIYFIISFKNLVGADRSAYAPHLTSHLIYLNFYSTYIILSIFKYDYSFDQQEVLIRLS